MRIIYVKCLVLDKKLIFHKRSFLKKKFSISYTKKNIIQPIKLFDKFVLLCILLLCSRLAELAIIVFIVPFISNKSISLAYTGGIQVLKVPLSLLTMQ